MSPTSYQAAPPRRNIIADGGYAVKPDLIFSKSSFRPPRCSQLSLSRKLYAKTEVLHASEITGELLWSGFRRDFQNIMSLTLPGAVSGVGNGRHGFRRRVHVRNAVAALFRTQRNIIFHRDPVFAAGHRIGWNGVYVLGRDQIVQR